MYGLGSPKNEDTKRIVVGKCERVVDLNKIKRSPSGRPEGDVISNRTLNLC